MGRGSDIGYSRILSRLNERDPGFQICQDEIIPMVALGTLFKVVIPLREHWLSTWPTSFQSGWLIWYIDVFRMAGGSGAAACKAEEAIILI